MISGFRHAGLKRLYERGDRRRLLTEHVPKIARVLAQLDIATDPDDMDLPGFHLHLLAGNLAGFRCNSLASKIVPLLSQSLLSPVEWMSSHERNLGIPPITTTLSRAVKVWRASSAKPSIPRPAW